MSAAVAATYCILSQNRHRTEASYKTHAVPIVEPQKPHDILDEYLLVQKIIQIITTQENH